MTDPRRHSWPSLAPDSSAVAAAAKTLRSYDVFDTVITRLVGDPSSAFLLLGQALVADGLWPLSAEQFAVARSEAETRARRHAAPREVTLASIYRELARSYNLEATVADQIADREIQIERRLIRAVPATGIGIRASSMKGTTVPGGGGSSKGGWLSVTTCATPGRLRMYATIASVSASLIPCR